jgi:hypothetical protein
MENHLDQFVVESAFYVCQEYKVKQTAFGLAAAASSFLRLLRRCLC